MIKNHEYIISSLEELEVFTRDEFLKFLTPKTDGATLIALNGDLGAGKTAFAKILAKCFGINEHITSPTFIIAKSYHIEESAPFGELVHIDAYRMEDPSEADVLRLPEMMSDTRKIILVEWPEQLGTHLPKPDITLKFRFIDETTRGITWI